MTTNEYSYAFTKNPTYESAAGRVQSPSREHSIVSAAVPYGDKGNRDVIEDSRFLLSRAGRF